MTSIRPSGAIFAALAGLSAAAWGLLLLGAGGTNVPTLCISATHWLTAAGASLDLTLALNPPGALLMAWTLMLLAMMPPLLTGPLLHVRQRSLARSRAGAMALFAAGYVVAWTAAGAALLAVALAARLAVPGGWAPPAVAALAALIWQVSPAKQRCLNRCHRLPHLAAFGWPARRDALGFGLSHGAWCVGACWLLMLLPMLTARGHLALMAAVMLFLLAERLERPAAPAWRWRAPTKAARILIAQGRLFLRSAGPEKA